MERWSKDILVIKWCSQTELRRFASVLCTYYCLNPISNTSLRHTNATHCRFAIFLKTPGTFIIMDWISSITFDAKV